MPPWCAAFGGLTTVLTLVANVSRGELWPIRVLLNGGISVWSHANDDLCPKARKAQALLAIIGVSPDMPILRQQVANLLWTSSEPSSRLARLRDLVHDLKASHGGIWGEVLDITSEKLAFRSGRVHVEFGSANDVALTEVASKRFLEQLEGIDPSLDRWLDDLRLSRSKASAKSEPSRLPDNERNARGLHRRCRLAVPAVDVVGLEISDLAGGLLNQISRSLTRLRWFKTVTRDSRGTVLRVGDQELSDLADYTLVSTLQSLGQTCGLSAELIVSGPDLGVVWSGYFEIPPDSTQYELAAVADKLAAQVDAELLAAEVAYAGLPVPVAARDPYRLVLHAIPAIYQLEREKFLSAGRLLEQAVECDPDSAFAHSWLAYWYIFLVGQGWARKPRQVLAQAGRAADRAMVLDPRDARGFAIAGHVRAFIGKHLDEAAALHEIALQLNPSLPLALHLSGMTSAYAGKLDEALSRIDLAQKLAATDAGRFFSEGALAIVHLLRHEHVLSAEIGQRVTQRHPNFTSAYKSTISALGHLGKKAAAQRLFERLRLLEPQFTLRGFQFSAPYRRREDLAHFILGLKLAGVD